MRRKNSRNDKQEKHALKLATRRRLYSIWTENMAPEGSPRYNQHLDLLWSWLFSSDATFSGTRSSKGWRIFSLENGNDEALHNREKNYLPGSRQSGSVLRHAEAAVRAQFGRGFWLREKVQVLGPMSEPKKKTPYLRPAMMRELKEVWGCVPIGNLVLKHTDMQ